MQWKLSSRHKSIIQLCLIFTCCFFLLMYTSYPSFNINVKVSNPHPGPNVILNIRSLPTKPHIVLGILSAEGKIAFRQTQRTTWINAMLQLKDKLPFRVTYKFLIDSPTNATIKENSIHRDILYLNISTHGRAIKFGEKLYTWLRYINDNFDDVILGAKLDDDAFLCVPQVFHRLDDLLSLNLYYGWKHNTGSKIYKDVRIDEMFVVLGINLIKRISNRKYCGMEKCPNNGDLIDINYADTSLAEWLSTYDDIDFKKDNDRIVQCGPNATEIYKKYIKPHFCEHHLIFHKSTTQIMKQLQKFNDFHTSASNIMKQVDHLKDISSNLDTNSSFIGSVTGAKFTGKSTRSLPPLVQISDTSTFAVHDNFTNCENWAVVTTIFMPSRSVKYLSKLPHWCLVIVADTKTPPKIEYLQNLIGSTRSSRIKYLSIVEQASYYPILSKVIPFKHFGRKNIGYMYAIHHKAKYIWDFDDDNNGVFNLDDLNKKSVSVCNGMEYFLINPYPHFGVSEGRVWPRGLPLQYIKDNKTIPSTCSYNGTDSVAVIQSLANEQPDVDAIFRLTRNVPFNFTGTTNLRAHFIIPKKSYSPFNAQATLWLSSAFKYMALPISVNGRVSDIWRGYIAQHFLHQNNLSLAFSPPYVVQERNVHEIIADFNAELDIYEKSLPMVELLTQKTYSDMKHIYEDLYSRKYLERIDLNFIRVWLKTLTHVLEQLRIS